MFVFVWLAALPCLQLLASKGALQASLRLYAGDAKSEAAAAGSKESKDKAPEVKVFSVSCVEAQSLRCLA